MRRALQWLVIPASLVILGLAIVARPAQSIGGSGPRPSCSLAPCKTVKFDSTLTDSNGITWRVRSTAVLAQTAVGSGLYQGTGTATETGTGKFVSPGCTTTVKSAGAANLAVSKTVLGPRASDVDLAMLPGITSDVEHVHCAGGGFTVDKDINGPFWYRLWILFHFGERMADGLDHITGFAPLGKTQAIKTYTRSMPAFPSGTWKEDTTIIVDLYDPCRYTVKSAHKAVKGKTALTRGQVLGAGDQIGVHLGGSVTLIDDLGNTIVLSPGLYLIDQTNDCQIALGPGPTPIPKKALGPSPITVKNGSEKDAIQANGNTVTNSFNAAIDALAGKSHSPDLASLATTSGKTILSFSYNSARQVTRLCVSHGLVRLTATKAPGRPSLLVTHGCFVVAGKQAPRPG